MTKLLKLFNSSLHNATHQIWESNKVGDRKFSPGSSQRGPTFSIISRKFAVSALFKLHLAFGGEIVTCFAGVKTVEKEPLITGLEEDA